ncbi:hypothetical protein ACQYWQ_17045 [Streptomyces sp. P6-2-1]|uniref:hypothetical protein n=1 Tax=Streptomyces sp. P6-2-1 TaxID=3422591 RepID=UPI003D35FB5F
MTEVELPGAADLGFGARGNGALDGRRLVRHVQDRMEDGGWRMDEYTALFPLAHRQLGARAGATFPGDGGAADDVVAGAGDVTTAVGDGDGRSRSSYGVVVLPVPGSFASA